MRKTALLLALAVSATLALPAAAHDVSISDPDDVSGPADLKTLAFSNHNRVRVCTWDPWANRDLRGNNDYLAVKAKLSSDEGWIISVYYKDGHLRVTGGHYGPIYAPMDLNWHRGNDRCITVHTKPSMDAEQWRSLKANSEHRGTTDHTGRLDH